MAKDNGPKPSPIAQLPSRCPVEGCSKKVERAEFCPTHFEWFKEGLINRQGIKPKDFDKKFQNYLKKHKPAA
jgi:hypothetical protein